MATITETAKAYEAKQTKNIAELSSVPTSLNVLTETGIDSNGESYSYLYVEFNGDKYRVPGKVFGDLKAILAKKPTLERFCVTKKGQGLQTQYTVIPLD